MRQFFWYALQLSVFVYVASLGAWQGNGYAGALMGVAAVIAVMLVFAALQGLRDGAVMLITDGMALLRTRFNRRGLSNLREPQSDIGRLSATDRHSRDSAKLVDRGRVRKDAR